MPEEEISSADVKAEYEKLNQQTEAEVESSSTETEVSESTSEVVKPVTEEVTDATVQTEEVEEKAVPYSRFKEVNEKVRNYEELEKEVGNLVERGPDGKLRIRQVEKSEPEDKGLELTEEEQLALDSVQTSVVSKLVQRELRVQRAQEENNRVYREQSNTWWNRAQEEFPQAKDKNSEFYKRADKIFREQYVKDLGKGQWTAPPNGHYLSCLQAEKELARDKVKRDQAIISERKTQKQQVFVEKKSGTQQGKKKADVKEFEKMSASEQEDQLREQFQETHPEE